MQKIINESMTVVRDCTGTYLRFEGKDYAVRNPEIVSSFSNGAQVKVTFKKLAECTGPAKEALACCLLHQSEGWMSVKTMQ